MSIKRNGIYLAPIAGYMDVSFRRLCAVYGAELTFTEMISAKGLKYGSGKTEKMISVSDEEGKAAVQLFGSDPETIAASAKKLMEKYADKICLFDVNMGCPAPKIVKNGEGSALMRNPVLASRIIETLKKTVDVPVTAKIRSGFDAGHINAPEFAKALEEGGADGVTVHPRTREQYYSGRADWDIIKRVKETVSISVTGNGDITSPEDVVRMYKITGCDNVMIARAAIGNPFIFMQVKEYLETGSYRMPGLLERVGTAKRHLRFACQDKGEAVGVREMRKHVSAYVKGMKNAARFREGIMTVTSEFEFEELLDRILKEGESAE